MNRDIDRMRELLLEVEASTLSDDLHYDGDYDCYQLKLLKDAGYVDCDIYEDVEWSAEVRQLTMTGHDFLDSIRDDVAWKYVKKCIEAAKTFTLPIIASIAEAYAKRSLGLGG